MPLVEAARTFTLLTVGDALVGQIPALIISTAAGIIITRAASSANLGEQITKQLLVNPNVIGMVAGILFLMGLTPGLPHFAFLLVGSLVAWLAYNLKKQEKKVVAAQKTALPAKGEEAAKADALDVVTPPDLLELHVGYGLVPLVDVAQGTSP